ncbi:hypothetical protein EJV46_04990 [Roseococcus sp. SYP-B2431]|uniref:hypothetical protein n=1 Tax=Roseococcus sp. SYP-B2431 TaxID=2496640 RepID=UPI00103F2326|nr:hypothetical protein [Roseococcus sp. SYP-B2431]TCI00016.1 hypothetical protein EJV46_04990 [Roseococcus sp. SYP-B2431]
MRRRSLLPLMSGLLAAPSLALPQAARAQTRQGPPHEWMFGGWTGGIFPATETQGPACFGNVTVIVTRDIVMRVSSLDVAFRQRAIETVAIIPDGLEFRFVPTPGRAAVPESGFGCDNNPNILRVRRVSDDEVLFTDCREFPSPLKRCKG